tara:strand:- start:21661 stop:21903 length:243 start_codon:yes stop_codon:yes gene_type:complete
MSNTANLNHPDNAEVVTPHDANPLPNGGLLYVGGAGDVSVVTTQGNAVVFKGVGAGQILPIRVRRVKATDTTATDILVLY